MLLSSFSLTGLRSAADFMLWRIGYDLDALGAMQDALMKTALGKSALFTEVRQLLVEPLAESDCRRAIFVKAGRALLVSPYAADDLSSLSRDSTIRRCDSGGCP